MQLGLLTLSILTDLIASLSAKPDAYLDPGSGSFILQVLIASLVGIGFTIRAYWGKISKFFGKKSQADTEDDLDSNDE